MVRTIHHTASARGFWPLFGDTRYTSRVIIKKFTIFSPQTYFYIIYWDGILDVGSAVGSTPTVVLVLKAVDEFFCPRTCQWNHKKYTSNFAMTLTLVIQ